MFDPTRTQPDLSTLLSRADEALYAAKDAGRNAVVVLADPPPGSAEPAGPRPPVP